MLGARVSWTALVAAFLLATAVSGWSQTANLALNRPAVASSAENAGTAANLALDGNTGTRWSSAFSDPQWIYVDLGATYAISRVTLVWEAAYGKGYQIQVSPNASTWTSIYSTATGDGGTDDLTGLSGSGRYVRLYGTTRATVYGYSLWELQVYGTNGATPTSTARPTATATSSATATPTTSGTTNLARSRPVTASSTENAGTAANLSVDGNAGTRWSSAFGDPQWIFVDLGAATAIGRVVLSWEAAYAKAYQLQTSNDAVSWTTVYSTTTGAGGVASLTVSGNGRYVRMYGTTRATAYGYSLWELEVYGAGGPTPTATPRTRATATATATAATSGDVVGKITVGYQAWFAAIGDASPINAWWHWSQNWAQTPSVAQNVIHAWPDTREYVNLYTTSYPNLGNGQPARLFSSFDQSTINLQMSWMKQYGVDTAALQRFNPTGGEGPIRDAVTARVRTAAEAVGVKFYIMYDVSGWTNMQSEIKNDWSTKMSAYASSTAYARQGGKPVVAIWGFGFNDPNHPWDAATCLDVVSWFKAQGVYVIGGVPREWRTGTGGSRAGFINVYHAFNMISPWMVGAIGNVTDADNHYNNELVPDQTDLNANGIAYQPCVLPGDTGQRAHGDFMWRQFYNAVRVGAQGIYISMFDEYNEGNQIAKTAEDASMSPSGTSSILFTLDQDGTRCSSDYYLRLTGDGGRMLKKQIALTATRPTSPQ